MTEARTIASPEARAIPPRWRWLRRLAIAAGVGLGGLAAIWFAWSYYAEWKLAATIAHYRGLGELVLPEDFPESGPNEPTPWPIEVAGLLAPDPNEGLSWDCVLDNWTLALEQPAAVDSLLSDNAAAIERMRRAQGDSICKMKLRPNRNCLAGVSFSAWRRAAKFANAHARVANLRGDEREATAGLELAADLADCAARYPVFFGHLIYLSVDALVSKTVMFIAPELFAGRPPDADLRSRIERLIARLGDEGVLRSAWREAMLGERAFVLDNFEAMYDGNGRHPVMGLPLTPAQSAWFFVMRPAVRLQAARMIGEFSAIAGQGAAASFDPIARRHPERPELTLVFLAEREWLRSVQPSTSDPLRRVQRLHLATIAKRRMAATALALRLFALDHGRAAERLDELVPRYLPAVPIDPFDPAGGPIRYRAAMPRPVLYSLGENGVDDSNDWIDALRDPTSPFVSPYHQIQTDIVFELRRENFPRWRFRPQVPDESEQRADDHPEDAEGGEQADGDDDAEE